MNRLYRFTGALILLLTLLCTSVRAQTTVAVMDFDGNGTEMTVSSSVPFADNGSAEFFGIYDANGDDTDGTPTDTGDTQSTTRPDNVSGAPVSGDFLFLVSENSFSPGSAETSLTIGPVDVTGQSDVVFEFFYRAYDFDGGDDIFYEFSVDGTPQGRVQIVDGANGASTEIYAGTVSYIVPGGAGSVGVTIYVDQAGDDYVAFDNFIVTADNPGLPCGVSSFGPSATETCVAFTNGTPNEYTLAVDYLGSDADGTLALLVDGNPASAFTNNGDDPTTTNGGTIDLSSPDLVEGTSYEITFTDMAGDCAYSVTGSVATGTCVSTCDLTLDPIRLFCDDFTAGTDAVSAEIRYFGSEPGVTVTASGGVTVSGNDPATEEGGTGAANTRKILLSGLQEGGTYTITISGGACTGTEEFVINATVDADLCVPVGDLVINEFYASPNTGAGEYEYIELYNRGLTVLDVSDYSVEEGAGTTIDIPAGTFLNPGEGLVIVGGMTPMPAGCQLVNAPFIGLNNDGDVIILRDENGLILQQYAYGVEADVQESLALSPDGNLDGGYQLHSTVSASGETSSPCMNNEDADDPLPVELLSFTGQADGKTVLLDWETASEIDNQYFVVERLVSGTHWSVLGTVPALNGRSNRYEFTDEAPAQGENIYRLQQIDTDGTAAVYGPVLVSITAAQFSVWPNPAGSEIRFGGNTSAGDHISLLDANGRVLRELPAGSDRADLSGLSAGVYLLRVARASGTEVVRFVKQ
ncbi:T9SS type A sorting domain-containing protein [Neolewinella aurantiaca]|uniref:T9SS type A sorting domain-containing protein n=1 Tax=Neolewinella aurantiaca TaxID=2602767 RepID=A0A5C7FMS5_9BACT|nr:lamin tail domain-containing protein [Neolewinella aurantiaca]TXF88782.1 T9SS type A sorting domain-containing protein [Neolewinella aurantiaca]